MIVHTLLERAVARAAEDEPALLAARSRWKTLAGEVFEDEALYEERITAFLEWYTLEFSPAPDVPPPIVRAAAAAPPEERAALAALASAHRSLFLVRAHHPDGEGTAVVVEDLWGGATFHVHERRRLIGLGPGELFEARLVADTESPPRLVFSRALCFHPREALPSVRAQVVRAGTAGESRIDLLFRLLRLRLKCERYRHVASARIYAEPRG